ncbi:hypothetical protein [Cyanobium sp. ATX 6F1]|uniref:hypothetical protein n=1 Tax=unclassified Cyanobium TaxID=2627006 RepID=UPI0020CCAF68|nr:hypothetical protein [Cyanobium sp. ATX 6F1]MCP9917332.1 hypothetical protein [Cyanobium sp. ATX 6F1]
MTEAELAEDNLFKAAVSYSLRKGKMKAEGDVDSERSRPTGQSFVLAAADGRVIDRIPLALVRKEAARLTNLPQELAVRRNETADERIARQRARRESGALAASTAPFGKTAPCAIKLTGFLLALPVGFFAAGFFPEGASTKVIAGLIGIVFPPIMGLLLSDWVKGGAKGGFIKAIGKATAMAGAGIAASFVLFSAIVFLSRPSDILNDGSARADCEANLKQKLRDPASYEPTGEWANGGDGLASGGGKATWTWKFRARNGFGGMNVSVASCVVDSATQSVTAEVMMSE